MPSSIHVPTILLLAIAIGGIVSVRGSAFGVALLAPVVGVAAGLAMSSVWVGASAFLLLQLGFAAGLIMLSRLRRVVPKGSGWRRPV